VCAFIAAAPWQEAVGATTQPPTAAEALTWDLEQRKKEAWLSTYCYKNPAAAHVPELVDGGPPTIGSLSDAVGTTARVRNNLQHYRQGGNASKAALLEAARIVPDRSMSSYIK